MACWGNWQRAASIHLFYAFSLFYFKKNEINPTTVTSKIFAAGGPSYKSYSEVPRGVTHAQLHVVAASPHVRQWERVHFLIQLCFRECATACLWVHTGSDVCSACLLDSQIFRHDSDFMSHLAHTARRKKSQRAEGRSPGERWRGACVDGWVLSEQTRSRARRLTLDTEQDWRGGK